MDTHVKPCPKCGRQPRILSTLVGTVYAACLDHVETAGQPTPAEAIAKWNAGEFEAPRARRQPGTWDSPESPLT